MPDLRGQGGNAGLVTPIRVDGVFDDPGAIRRLVERNGPYRTMASFLPDSAVRGRRATGLFRPRSGQRARGLSFSGSAAS